MRVVGASLLVAGTTIGGAVLGLPLLTGMAGFLPTLLLLVPFWLLMTTSAFFFLEVTLWFDREINLVTMAKKTLGVPGQVVTWLFYLFLLYALTTAYLAGCSPLFLDLFELLTGARPEPWFGYVPLLFLFGFFIYRGTSWVDHINRCMMVGLLICFFYLLALLFPKVELSYLLHVDFAALPMSIGILATSFGFHIIIPTLVTYLKRDVKLCRQAIGLGSMFPLVGYVLWLIVTLGVLPLTGPISIAEGLALGTSSSEQLFLLTDSPFLKVTLRLFSFFLIITSFLGVSLSLFDFLADGFRIRKTRLGRGMLYFLTFAPPLWIALNYPRIFLEALDLAGVFGVLVLLVMLPCLMVLVGRKTIAKPKSFQVKGGTGFVVVVFFVAFALVVYQLLFANV